MNKLARLVRLATLHETRSALIRGLRSAELRDVARRARTDRRSLLRELRDPSRARAFAAAAVRHPATRELADAGLMFLPGRFLPLGWAASWAANRIWRRRG